MHLAYLFEFFIICVLVFFSKQKTAYELRCSDWSSDVCSSDLTSCSRLAVGAAASVQSWPAAWPSQACSARHSATARSAHHAPCAKNACRSDRRDVSPPSRRAASPVPHWPMGSAAPDRMRGTGCCSSIARSAMGSERHPDRPGRRRGGGGGRRSEEHTSELQSLMRISYAVFCLKKKSSLHHRH